MNEDSGSSQVRRPFPRSEQRADGAAVGSSRDSLYLSDTVTSHCPTAAAVQYSWKASPVADYTLPWPVMREPGMTQQHVPAWRAGRRNAVLSPRGSSATTRRCISLQEEPYFKAEHHISSWATPKLTKQQLVTAVLEWPIEAVGQGAAGLPSEPCQEGWRRQRSPSHLCPLGCVLTTALGPGDPTQTS